MTNKNNKMNTIKISIIPILLLSALLFAFSGCEKTTHDIAESSDQLFRPVRFEAEVDDQKVTLSWIPIRQATYSIELINDTDSQLFTVPNAKVLIIEDLKAEVQYTAKIKAISIDQSKKDSEYQEISFTTGISK